MLDHLGDAQKKENHKFTSYESVDTDSPLWRADWGIKQWIPYLLGMSLVLVLYVPLSVVTSLTVCKVVRKSHCCHLAFIFVYIQCIQ